jgi:hypothetical protein
MRHNKELRNRAQTRSRAAREAQPINLTGRLAFSPRESGAVVGKSATYIYRMIYAGKLKPICDCGRMMISRDELQRFLSRGSEYNPRAKVTSAAGKNGGEK